MRIARERLPLPQQREVFGWGKKDRIPATAITLASADFESASLHDQLREAEGELERHLGLSEVVQGDASIDLSTLSFCVEWRRQEVDRLRRRTGQPATSADPQPGPSTSAQARHATDPQPGPSTGPQAGPSNPQAGPSTGPRESPQPAHDTWDEPPVPRPRHK